MYSVPSAPAQDLSVIPLTPYSLSISWQAPPPDTQNGEIRFYIIGVLEVDTGTQSSYNTSNNSNNFTLQSLHPYYLYHISVAAATVGLGPYSPVETIRMQETGLFSVMRGEFYWTMCMDIVVVVAALSGKFV